MFFIFKRILYTLNQFFSSIHTQICYLNVKLMLLLSSNTIQTFINHKLSNKIMKEENDSSSIYRMASFASPVYHVAGKLIEAGYRVAGRAGVEQKQLDPNMITILKDRKPVQISLFGLRIPFLYKKSRGLNVGKVYFNDSDRNATEDENWVFEPHGIKEESKVSLK